MAEEAAWVNVQKKTFTKWANAHLSKKGYPTLDYNKIEKEFQTGQNLANLIAALYPNVPKPKLKEPKLDENGVPARITCVDNTTQAMKMIEDAQIKTNFLKNTHLIDCDQKMILGMLWAIILDFQIKGISVDELSAKEGLLLWCQKKTAGYKDVKVENFTNSWTSGLAFLALIHRHRPDLVDYNAFSKDDPEKNLRTAFTVAERDLGIAALLDVEDLLNVAKPDERSIMTYVSEYFHKFAGMDLKETAASRIGKFLGFMREMEELQNDYERRVRALLAWVEATKGSLNDRSFPDSAMESKKLFEAHKQYLVSDKSKYIVEKLDCEALLADIQIRLKVNNRRPYVPPADVTSEAVDSHWATLEKAEGERGRAVRDNMFRFVSKSEATLSPEKRAEIEQSFDHFDKDKNGTLDRVEFKAALSALSIPFRDENAFNELFNQVAQGNPRVSREQYIAYTKNIYEDKDTPEAIAAAFQALADGSNTIHVNQLKVPGLSAEDLAYLEKIAPGDTKDINAILASQFNN